MSFTQDEIGTMKQTAEALERWAEVDWQYTVTNCEAHKQTVGEIMTRILCGVQNEKPVTCRYQISLLRALSKFEIFYERMLCDNETQAKYVKDKYDRLREYTQDTYKPGLPDSPAPWIAREYAADLAKTLRSIMEKSREDSAPEKPAETRQNPTKRGRLKPILCAISGLVVFLAALLTIFHLLGWLEPIRAFIYNIVSHN